MICLRQLEVPHARDRTKICAKKSVVHKQRMIESEEGQ